MCLMMYTLEAAALLLAFGPRQFFSDWIGTLDVIIVSCGWAESLGDEMNPKIGVIYPDYYNSFKVCEPKNWGHIP